MSDCFRLSGHGVQLRAPIAGQVDALEEVAVYQLPPYAPDLNPVEGVWLHLKRSLANLTKHNLEHASVPPRP